jgi:hypothetical protein
MTFSGDHVARVRAQKSVLRLLKKYTVSSLYEDPNYEISLVRSFITKRVPTAWLVIRNLENKIEHVLTKRKRKEYEGKKRVFTYVDVTFLQFLQHV